MPVHRRRRARCGCSGMPAAARSRTSPPRPAWICRFMRWARPPATSTTTAARIVAGHRRRTEPVVPQRRRRPIRRRHRQGGPRQARRASAPPRLWIDYDRDGLLDLVICNYVRWTPKTDIFCSADGKTKSYCTPEAYPGATSWLYRNKGNGTFEDVTAVSGLLDTTSKALGVTMLDFDLDGWPDLFMANDTQPNKLYRNRRRSDVPGSRRAGRPGVQRGRPRAGGDGHRRRRLRQQRGAVAGRHQFLRRDARALQSGASRRLRRSRAGLRAREGHAGRRSASAASSSTPISTACSICSSSTATSTTGSPRTGRRQLRGNAAPVPQPRERPVRRHRPRRRRRIRGAQGRPRRGLRRHRSAMATSTC